MSDDDTLKFRNHDEPIDDEGDKVPCAKCGKLIDMRTSRCPHCGIYFRGAAMEYEYANTDDQEAPRHPRTMRRLALLLLIVLLGGAVAMVASVALK